MSEPPRGLWIPRPADVAEANVTALARLLGLPDYAALYAFSIAEPGRYWDAVNRFCRIVWSRDYGDYVDLSAGREFPRWFVGGELNWVDSVLAWAERPETAGKAAIVAESETGPTVTVTYPQLRGEVRSLAAGLLARGIARGDRVGLLMESGVEATASLLALSYIGAIVVPLFTGFGAEAIAGRLQACGARGIIATAGFSRRGKFVDTSAVVLEVMTRLPGLDFVVLKGAAGALPEMLDWAALKRPPAEAPPAARMTANDPFMVIYTSGTTGRPKGAVHTHGGFPLKIAHDAALHFDVENEDVFCWPADIGWIAGSLVIASALLRGATLVCYDGAPDFPDWSRLSRLIERHRITHFGSAPTLIRGLAANPAVSTAGDVVSVKLLITAGEGIAPEHFLWFQRHFGRGECPLINYTGGTEVSGCLLSSVPVLPIVPGGFNTPSPGVAVDVVDLAGDPVRNRIGELAILEPFVGMTQAFWQDDERYLEAYWRTVPGKWIHGDLALRDDSDTFFLLGRSDDTIKVAGKRVGPAEVEQIVVEIGGVSEAAVIGAEDPIKGQALVVFVTAAAGSSIPATSAATLGKTISDRIQQRLGKPFAPKEVHLVPQLPKTRSSKIMRRVIRSVYGGTPPGDLSSLVNPESIMEIERVLRGQ